LTGTCDFIGILTVRLANDLTPKHHNDQISSVHKLMSFLGQSRRIKNISTLDLQNYKRKLQGAYGSVCRLNLRKHSIWPFLHTSNKDSNNLAGRGADHEHNRQKVSELGELYVPNTASV